MAASYRCLVVSPLSPTARTPALGQPAPSARGRRATRPPRSRSLLPHRREQRLVVRRVLLPLWLRRRSRPESPTDHSTPLEGRSWQGPPCHTLPIHQPSRRMQLALLHPRGLRTLGRARTALCAHQYPRMMSHQHGPVPRAGLRSSPETRVRSPCAEGRGAPRP